MQVGHVEASFSRKNMDVGVNLFEPQDPPLTRSWTSSPSESPWAAQLPQNGSYLTELVKNTQHTIWPMDTQ